jgi:hypothetical protein
MNYRSLRFPILFALFALIASAAWADDAKVQVCHVPPGNPGNFHTITVGQDALQAHLDHGDLAGACSASCDILCSDGKPCTTGECGCPCVDGLPGFIEVLNGEFGLTSCHELGGLSDYVQLTADDGRILSSSSGFNNGCTLASESLFLSQEEAVRCNALVRQKAAAAGLTCTPF